MRKKKMFRFVGFGVFRHFTSKDTLLGALVELL